MMNNYNIHIVYIIYIYILTHIIIHIYIHIHNIYIYIHIVDNYRYIAARRFISWFISLIHLDAAVFFFDQLQASPTSYTAVPHPDLPPMYHQARNCQGWPPKATEATALLREVGS